MTAPTLEKEILSNKRSRGCDVECEIGQAIAIRIAQHAVVSSAHRPDHQLSRNMAECPDTGEGVSRSASDRVEVEGDMITIGAYALIVPSADVTARLL